MADFDEIRQQLDLLKDEELLTILREHDQEQWRPEVFDIVASILNERGVSPAAGPEHSDHEEETEEGIPEAYLAPVAGYFNQSDAEEDLLILENEGVRAWIFNEVTRSGEGPADIVRLKVLKEDLKTAMEILSSEKEDFKSALAILRSEPVSSSYLPEEIAEPPCPKCGSRKVTEEAEIVESHDFSSRSVRSTPEQVWLYKCSACGHKWSDS